MASTTLLFLLLSVFCVAAAAQQRGSNISRGSSLTPTSNSFWLSPNRLYAFGFYKQGDGYYLGIFLNGIPQKTVVWTANRDDPPVPSTAALHFTSEGRLRLETQAQQKEIANSTSASSASMLDSGNFVLYNSDGDMVWQSFDLPTDTLLLGQRLLAGKELFSSVSETNPSTGMFRLKMQNDGNLVQYPVKTPDAPTYAYYATGTGGVGDNVTLHLDGGGHIYLLNTNGSNIKNITDGGYDNENLYLIRIDPDGIFKLYSHDSGQNGSWSILWRSSNDKCVPKGLCGLNAFCVLLDGKPDCKCLPGFDFVVASNRSSGCIRNFQEEICKSKDGSTKYTMSTLENTWWEDASYSILSLPTQEDCEQACLEDCNCEAALFQHGSCRKLRIPLLFGRRSLGDSNILFVKVSSPEVSPQRSKKELQTGILVISVSLASFALIIFAISGVLILRKNLWAYKKISETGNVELTEDVALRSFTYMELEKVTNGFKEEIGKGASGTVYKGATSNGQRIVAVKKLEKVLAEGEREFQNELKVIGRTHHRNLVRLLGYCLDRPNRLLVYEYMSNGSLADWLFIPGKQPRWSERMGIALNVARGILYLHEECETRIIHCDIKPQNILMDEYRCAKISDFGLAKLLMQDQTNTSTGIRGTRGYVAPEWHRKQPVTVKADVYSYGIVLLETICCRRNVDWSLPDEEAILEEWVYQCFEAGELGKLVGDEEVDRRQLDMMVKVGLWCILDEPSLRPSMKKVLLMLEGTVDIPVPPSPVSFLSSI
ncbi:G-type lectin S-receptor-like serine/threonine-protein kinase LECRK1 [Vitis vinifera]|uniref:Receptor-like serine/threonine-protein kinase n=1 Tax=Vitis vinifera TaxID=29760 RepID=A0A438HLG1_VITVI|nr:G-type lectin S-receptor-like serine/threonine-protein kinase LECRK1 [Vitis vinifera]